MIVLMFLVCLNSSIFCAAPTSQQSQAFNLLQKLEESPYGGVDVQYKIFKTLLDISNDKEVDAEIAHYSRISKTFYKLVHSERGQNIIKERRKFLIPLQKRLVARLGSHFGIDIVKDGINAQNKSTNDTALLLLASHSEPSAIIHEEPIRDARLANDLIFYGANPNIQNYAGRTALMQAAFFQNRHMLMLLLSSGANPNLQDIYGRTALMLYLTNDTLGFSWKILDRLLEKTDLWIKDKWGNIALGYAQKSPDVDGRYALTKEVEEAMYKREMESMPFMHR